eukprot:CAMPEP_0168472532 /NCGR_PEP_ID=MMETSP0228-20121227/59850_1 /TAXON_ID=133427 /ORGANISM="Protoceratium reticulatum, Strain CCCM 535 (=CCMP 1889)" /LENGTH=39 /DNA_ID= /DNA_START= /DNA_END= /DNA_ORIENTATION=
MNADRAAYSLRTAAPAKACVRVDRAAGGRTFIWLPTLAP